MTLKLVDSVTAKEEKYLKELYILVIKALDHDSRQAKKIFNDHIFPYMLSQLRTLDLQGDQIVGCMEQNGLLLQSNALLIHALKENGIPLPNLDALARERFQEDSDIPS